MTGGAPRRTLPIRRWLALALAATFVLPFVATAATAFHVVGVQRSADADAARMLRDNVARWDDPAWQAATRATLRGQGIDFVLVDGTREIYRSAADPLAGVNDARVGGPGGWWDSGGRPVRRLVVAGADPPPTAYIYGAVGSRRNAPYWLIPLAGFSMLLLTLGGIAWVLGRAVNAPLAATGRAARRVADGDLDIALPGSRVREVAEVNAAFEQMSVALRATLDRQAELEQERRLFIGAIVHDLRTPLFALRGYLEGIQRGLADTPEKREHYVAVAQEKADALERLITDLFDYTRLEYLDQAPKRQLLDLAALLRRLVDSAQPRAAAKGINLALADAAGPCVVDADGHLLTRAIENLLDNALRYTPAGGAVRVACGPAPGGARFTVTDTGPGIPPADLPHLFTPLFRGETSRNRRTGGAGLGLTIARRILQAHGGDLRAANAPDGGAVFTGWLPNAERGGTLHTVARVEGPEVTMAP